MTAIIYFGEMLVVSTLAIVLLAISQLRMSSGAAPFAGGVVALTLAEYVVHRFLCCMVSHRPNIGCIMPTPTGPSSQFFGRYGFVSR
jgi:hypothetical protein